MGGARWGCCAYGLIALGPFDQGIGRRDSVAAFLLAPVHHLSQSLRGLDREPINGLSPLVAIVSFQGGGLFVRIGERPGQANLIRLGDLRLKLPFGVPDGLGAGGLILEHLHNRRLIGLSKGKADDSSPFLGRMLTGDTS